MPVNRFFYDGDLVPRETISFSGEEAKHISRVLRLDEGDTVEVTNGKGKLATGSITSISKHAVEAVLETTTEHTQTKEIHLWQALLRPSKLDLIVEKGTELGVTHFHFFKAEHSEKDALNPHQQERLRTLAKGGCKQSGRLFVPELFFTTSVEEITGGFFGDISSDAPHILTMDVSSVLHFVNGPESGFTEKEYSLFIEKSVKGVSLSDAVLRTETAAIVAAAFMQAVHYSA